MEKDPVCGMCVDEESAAAKMEYQGQTYFFCAQSCKEKFEKSPEQYIEGGNASPVVQEVEERKRLPKDTEDLKRLDLPIKGISCASCVAKIEKGLSQLRGVVDAKVNFATEKAAIAFDPNQVHMSDLIGGHHLDQR